MKRLLFCLLFVLASSNAWAVETATAAVDPSADDLLQLQAAQAESLDTLDAEIETTVSGEDGVTSSARARIQLDKVNGTTRVQKLDADGKVALDMKTEGTTVSFLTPAGWHSVQMDPQTQATLTEMGVDFGDGAADATEASASAAAVQAQALPTPTLPQARQRGLAGHGKLPQDVKQRRQAKRQRIQKQVQRLKKRFHFERRRDLDQDTPADVMADVHLDQPLGFETQGLLTSADGSTPTAWARHRHRKSRALWRRRLPSQTGGKKGAAAAPVTGNDATLEIVDEDTGVAIETSHFMRADRVKDMIDLDGSGGQMDVTDLAAKRGNKDYAALKGKPHPFKHKKVKLPPWARRIHDTDGADLVEMQRTRVLKMMRVGDAVVPEETEQTDITAMGEIRQHTLWKHRGVAQ